MDLNGVLADPVKYAGKRIQLRGFLVNEHENQGLYTSAAEARNPRLDGTRSPQCQLPALVAPMRALWWQASGTSEVACNQLQVSIEGTFDPCEAGHMSLFSGGLMDVNFVRSE